MFRQLNHRHSQKNILEQGYLGQAVIKVCRCLHSPGSDQRQCLWHVSKLLYSTALHRWYQRKFGPSVNITAWIMNERTALLVVFQTQKAAPKGCLFEKNLHPNCAALCDIKAHLYSTTSIYIFWEHVGICIGHIVVILMIEVGLTCHHEHWWGDKRWIIYCAL